MYTPGICPAIQSAHVGNADYYGSNRLLRTVYVAVSGPGPQADMLFPFARQ